MYNAHNDIDYSLNIRGKLVSLDTPLIMGILNMTPDSFYSDSQNIDIASALKSADKMVAEGADIIDIGGMSTRPFSDNIDQKEELHRVKEIIPILSEKHPEILLSIDTIRSNVADYALNNGVHIVNDISACTEDKRMIDIIVKYKCPVVIMHRLGSSRTMQIEPQYDNLLKDIAYYLSERVRKLYDSGINDVIVDLGFGFGKTVEHNFELLKNISYFNILDCPMLVGISRKSMIYKPLDTTPQDALVGTAALHFDALRQGAKILRVHDVKEAVQVKKLYLKYTE